MRRRLKHVAAVGRCSGPWSERPSRVKGQGLPLYPERALKPVAGTEAEPVAKCNSFASSSVEKSSRSIRHSHRAWSEAAESPPRYAACFSQSSMSTSGRPARRRSSSATETMREMRCMVSRGRGSCSPLRNASTCRLHRSSPSLCSTFKRMYSSLLASVTGLWAPPGSSSKCAMAPHRSSDITVSAGWSELSLKVRQRSSTLSAWRTKRMLLYPSGSIVWRSSGVRTWPRMRLRKGEEKRMGSTSPCSSASPATLPMSSK
mmetsp:Transcript_56298/g.115138  ORF Transcript_56298/g.115138 Transcript_56298/m.115138 type:complete len:260 (-) Transcript_56298:60-839(-)